MSKLPEKAAKPKPLLSAYGRSAEEVHCSATAVLKRGLGLFWRAVVFSNLVRQKRKLRTCFNLDQKEKVMICPPYENYGTMHLCFCFERWYCVR